MPSESMHAVVVAELGGPEQLELQAIERPTPGVGQIRVRVEAASVNPVDTKLRSGALPFGPALPAVLGCDVAGIVDAIGPGVDGFGVGDRVYGCAGGVAGRPGSYAQYMLADHRLLAPRPTSVGAREAAALPLVGITAWEALVERARVEPGTEVFVFAGTGGVGHIGVSLARALGAIVTTTVGDTAKLELARSLGATTVIDRRVGDPKRWREQYTGGRGWPVVFDTVGPPALGQALELVATHGHVVSALCTGPIDVSPLLFTGARLDAIFMLLPMLTSTGLEQHGQILRRLATLVDAGRLRPLVDERRFTLANVGEAHRALEAGDALGKLVIDVA